MEDVKLFDKYDIVADMVRWKVDMVADMVSIINEADNGVDIAVWADMGWILQPHLHYQPHYPYFFIAVTQIS